jgi:hypothetical protein
MQKMTGPMLEDSVPNDDDDGNNDPLFSHTADRPKLMSREKHSLCFTNKFLMLMTSYHKAKLHDHSLILCPPRPQVGMSVHPHELLQQTTRQINVAGKMIILSLNQSASSHRYIERKQL